MPIINLQVMHREFVQIDRCRSKPLEELEMADVAPMRVSLQALRTAKVFLVHDDTHFMYLKGGTISSTKHKYPLSVMENHIGQILLQSGVESIQCR